MAEDLIISDLSFVSVAGMANSHRRLGFWSLAESA
jgi:hypothetical protein